MTSQLEKRLDILGIFAETQALAYNEGTRLHPSRGTCEEQFMPEDKYNPRTLRRSIKVPTRYSGPP